MLSDARYVARSLLRARWYALGALMTFALGTGVNLAIFAIVDRILFRPLPYGEAGNVLTVHRVDPQTGQVFFMFPKGLAVEAKRSIPAVVDFGYAGNTRSYYLEGPDNPPLRLTDSSFNLLEVLRVSPALGRGFNRDDALARRRLVLLRDEVWRSRYAGTDAIFNRTLADRAGGAQVVGILPPGFVVPSVNWATATDGLLLAADTLDSYAEKDGIPGFVVRVRTGSSSAVIQQQVEALVTSTQQSRAASARTAVRVESVQRGMFWNCRIPLSLLFAGGLLVWLISCVNLGTLLAARARALEQQTAIRASLGASKGRLLRLTFIEAALLAFAGSALAVLVLFWSMRTMAALIPSYVKQLALTSIDVRVVMFALAGTVLGTLIASLYPLWRVWRSDQVARLSAATSRNPPSRRRGQALLVVESGICTLLILAGALAVQSFVGLVATDVGFAPNHLYAVTLRLPAGQDTPNQARHRRVIDLFRAQPGVADVTLVDVAIGSGQTPNLVADSTGRQYVRRQIFENYFEVMRSRLRAGRAFTAAEVAASAPIAILSEAAVRSMWPGGRVEEAVGRDVVVGNETARRVIGVVGDTRPRHALPVQAEVFVPDGNTESTPAFLVRVEPGRSLDLGSLRSLFRRELGPSASLTVTSIASQLEPWLQDPKLYAEVFGIFGLVGLFLSAVGLGALTSYEVSLRRHDIGVRLALGATSHDVERLIVTQSLKPVLLGVVLGLIAAFCGAQVMQSLLHEVSARGLMSYAGAALLLLLTAAFCAWRPARMASRTDPLIVLRTP